MVSRREEGVCSFLEGGKLVGGSDYRLIYRHYATLYFIFCVDSSESELGILDLIQVELPFSNSLVFYFPGARGSTGQMLRKRLRVGFDLSHGQGAFYFKRNDYGRHGLR